MTVPGGEKRKRNNSPTSPLTSPPNPIITPLPCLSSLKHAVVNKRQGEMEEK